MRVIGIFVVTKVMRIDEISGRSYEVRRRKDLGLNFEKYQHLSWLEEKEEHQDWEGTL